MSMKPLNPHAREYRPITPEAPLPPRPAVQVAAIPSPKLVQLPHQLIPQAHEKALFSHRYQMPFLGFTHYMLSCPAGTHPLNLNYSSLSLLPVSCVAENNVHLGHVVDKAKSPKSPPLTPKINSAHPHRHRERKFLLPPRQRGTARRSINKATGGKPRVDLKARKSSTTKGGADLPPPTAPPLSNENTMKLTTVMVKNIPNQLRRDFMLSFLDHHCRTYSLEYDFMYLPMDFSNGNNLGYAFVNFTTAAAAKKFMNILQKFEWGIVQTDRGTYTSKKICEITWAAIQGITELVKRFEDSIFKCKRLDYLPVVLDPPRNGLDTNPPAPIVLGTWQYRRAPLRR